MQLQSTRTASVWDWKVGDQLISSGWVGGRAQETFTPFIEGVAKPATVAGDRTTVDTLAAFQARTRAT